MARKKKAKGKKAVKKVKGMLLDAASLCVHKMTGAEDGRYALTNVKLEPDGTTVATTGFMMVAVQPGGDDLDDFPEVGAPAAVPKDGALIPRDVCADAIKAMPKRGIRPVLANALLTRCGKDGVELATTDLSRTKKVGAPKVDGTFPDWRGMLKGEHRDRPLRATLGVRALKKLLDTLSPHLAHDADSGAALVFEFSPTQRLVSTYQHREVWAEPPVLVRGNLKAERGGKVLVVLAQMRVKDRPETPEFSDWEKGVLGWEDKDDEAPDRQVLKRLANDVGALLTALQYRDDSAPSQRFSDLLAAAADELVEGVGAEPEEPDAVVEARDAVDEAIRVLRGLPAEETKADENPDPFSGPVPNDAKHSSTWKNGDADEPTSDDPADDDDPPEEPQDDPPDDDSSLPEDDATLPKDNDPPEEGTDTRLSPTEHKIYACLSFEPRSLDDIGAECKLSPAEVSAGLLVLEIRRRARQLPGKMFVRMGRAGPDCGSAEKPDDEPAGFPPDEDLAKGIAEEIASAKRAPEEPVDDTPAAEDSVDSPASVDFDLDDFLS